MSKFFEITREIGIDAAHRVPDHRSKCYNIHGHRYVVQATCKGPLYEVGEQRGMVLDFGFLKDEMMDVIDAEADHAFLVWKNDPVVRLLLGSGHSKLVILDFVPTAENLAAYWFNKLAPRVTARTDGAAWLELMRVHETPNCFADYRGSQV